MGNDNEFEIDELEKSIQKLVKEETNVAKAFVDEEKNKSQQNSVTNPDFSDSLDGATRMIDTDSVKKNIAKNDNIRTDYNDDSAVEKDTGVKRIALIVGAIACVVVLVIAIVLFVVLNSGNKKSFAYNYDKGMSYYNNYNYNEAYEYLSYAYTNFESGKRNVELMRALYKCLEIKGDKQDAIKLLEAILDVDKNNTDSIKALAEYYYEDNNGEKLTALLRKYENTENEGVLTAYKVAVPRSSHEAGPYAEILEISLSADSNCKIYYTKDGSEPTVNSAEYTKKIEISETTTIKAVAVNSIGVLSEVKEFKYEIKLIVPEAPELVPDKFEISEDTIITIENLKDGYKAYYTTDGTTPTKDSKLYVDGIQLEKGNHILSVIIIDNVNISSPITRKSYTVKESVSYTYDEAIKILVARMESNKLLMSDGETFTSGGTVDFVYQSTREIDDIKMFYIRVDNRSNSGTKTVGYYGVGVNNGKTYVITGSGTDLSSKEY